jgi:hypothetical protein
MLVSVALPAPVRITSGRSTTNGTTIHADMLIINGSFLEGPKASLVASKDFEDGHYREPPQHGIRAFARVYCAWAYGQTVRSLPVYFMLLHQIS